MLASEGGSQAVAPAPGLSMPEKTPDDIPQDEVYSVFSDRFRIYLTYLLGFVIILSTLTATIYFPLIPMLSSHFSVSIQSINLTVTLYAVFQGISPSFFASLADSQGRRPVLLTLIAIYVIASLGLALNRRSYAALLVLRAFQSIGGSATPAIAYGIVADVSVVSERGKMLGPMLSFCNGISAVGPVIGGAVAQSTGAYTRVFLALLVVAMLCFLLVGFTLPETARNKVGNGALSATGLSRTWYSIIRSYTSSKCTCPTSPAHKDPILNPQSSNAETIKWNILDVFKSLRIIFYPDAAAVLWMLATSYSVYYTFQVAIPTIYENVYSYNDLEIGLAFLPGLAGMTAGGMIAGKLVDINFAKIARENNVVVNRQKSETLKDFPIETARYRNCIVFVAFEVALVIGYGWAIVYEIHPAIPLVMQFFICGLSTLLSHTASALLVDIFPDNSSTSYASGQIMRCGLSAVSAAVLQPLIDSMGRGWCFTVFGLFIGASGLVSVAISRKKGMIWRRKRQNT